MALEYGKEPLQAKTISEQEDIPRKYIEQLITVLKRGGLVGSLSGPHGGYVLVKSPSEISMKDVVGALESPMVPVECHEHPECVSRCSYCIMSQIWHELQGAIMGALEKSNVS
jgi:Rrf2 family protein